MHTLPTPLVIILCGTILAAGRAHAGPLPAAQAPALETASAERSLAPTAAPSDPAPKVIVPATAGGLASSRITRYRALGLPEARLDEFLQSGRSLTDWYNREHIGGRGLKIAGWVIFALGAVGVTIGAAFLISGSRTACDGCDDWGSLIDTYWIGLPALVIGLAEIAVGLPMAVTGMERMKRWVPGDALDSAPIADLKGRRTQPRSSLGTQISVLPYLAPGGGGLSFSLRL